MSKCINERVFIPTSPRCLPLDALQEGPGGALVGDEGGQVAQSELGRATAWTTKLPRGELADRIALEYSAVGVDMSHVVMTDEGRVALDVNFRSLLWDGEQTRAVLEPIARGASILFCSRTDAGIVFGIPGQGVDVCRALREEIGAPTVVSTDGRAGTYLSTAAEGERVYEIKSVPVIDRPGAGDSFVAGTLHGWLDGDVGRGIEMGTKVAQLALTHHGDLTHVRPGELLALHGSDIVR